MYLHVVRPVLSLQGLMLSQHITLFLKLLSLFFPGADINTYLSIILTHPHAYNLTSPVQELCDPE